MSSSNEPQETHKSKFFFERMLLNESEYMNKASQDVEYIDVNK